MPEQPLRVNPQLLEDAPGQKLHKSASRALTDTGAHHGTGDTVVKISGSRLMHNLLPEKTLDPVRSRHLRLAVHSGGHGGYMAYPQLLPPWPARCVNPVFRKQIDQTIVQSQNPFLHCRPQRNPRYGLGQRLAAMDDSFSVGSPISLQKRLPMPGRQKSVGFGIQPLKRIQEATGSPKGNASRTGRYAAHRMRHCSIYAASCFR